MYGVSYLDKNYSSVAIIFCQKFIIASIFDLLNFEDSKKNYKNKKGSTNTSFFITRCT